MTLESNMEATQIEAIKEYIKSPAITFFLSLLLGYPLGFIYRFFIAKRHPNLQHIFFLLCGLSISLLNFGFNTIHSMILILLMYFLLQVCGGTSFSVAMAFAINMGYLLTGYYFNATLNYSITWTTPQCIMCLRLIGLAYDVYDGTQKAESLSAEQMENALPYKPSLCQMLGFSYYFGGFLVGPQFSMRRYMELVNGVYLPDTFTPGFLKMVFSNLGLGIFYVLVFQVSNIYLPDTILYSTFFMSCGFFLRCFIIMVWAKFMLYKYIGCWLVAEGVCRVVGLGYMPLDKSKEVVCLVDATGVVGELMDQKGNPIPPDQTPVVLCQEVCSNIKPYNFEVASTCDEMIHSFNINTNKWMARYIFKRCKGLGNRNASHLITLIFLAIWHGLFSGYIVNFMLEFFIVKVENEFVQVPSLMACVKQIQDKGGRAGYALLFMMKKIHMQFVLAFALISFNLFTYPRYLPVYASVYYCLFISHVVIWPLLYHLVLRKKHRD